MVKDYLLDIWSLFEGPANGLLDVKHLLDPIHELSCSIFGKESNFYFSCQYGRIEDLANTHLLVFRWQSTEDFEISTGSKLRNEMLNVIKSYSNKEPLTRPFCYIIRPGFYEFRIIYYPAPMSPETEQAVMEEKGLSYQLWFGDLKRDFYRSGPGKFWAGERLTWNGREVVAQVWVNSWVNAEREAAYKAKVRDDVTGQLKVEYFDDSLRSLGALGWDTWHVTLDSWLEFFSDKESDDNNDANNEEDRGGLCNTI